MDCVSAEKQGGLKKIKSHSPRHQQKSVQKMKMRRPYQMQIKMRLEMKMTRPF